MSGRVLAVHAHPDDEALFTGGTLARFAREGVHVALVTCTAGEMGAGAGDGLAARRLEELEASCSVLGVAEHHVLGYADSGNGAVAREEGFARADVAAAATRVAEIVRAVRPDVVITYDARGVYGHPDHVRAHEVTVAAVRAAHPQTRLLAVVLPRSVVAGALLPVLLQVDADLFDDASRTERVVERWSVDDVAVAEALDVTPDLDRKYAALGCYASQAEPLRPFLEQPPAARPRFEWYSEIPVAAG